MVRKISLFLIVLSVLLLTGAMALAQDDEFVFGIILVGLHDDRGWSQSHYEGGLYIEENIPGARMLYADLVNSGVPDTPIFQDAVNEMIAEGAELIFTTSDAFEEDTDRYAADNPDVIFINTTGDTVLEETAPPNVGNYNSQFEMGRAASGCAAALATQTGNIGYLGALINPETRRHAASAYLGARYCYENFVGGDPDELEFTVTWIGFWFNIPGVTLDPTEVSNNFFDIGADVVVSGIDTTEALAVAGQRRAEGEEVWALPTDNPAGCNEAPEACLGSSYYNWQPGYLRIANAVNDGTWTQSWDWEAPDYSDFNNLDTSPVGYAFGDALTEEQTANLEQFLADMAAFATDPANENALFLWQGPLNLQDGTELAAEGENVDPIDVWYLPQLLEGMVGPSTSE
jgi:simple sugar transport system substrate-binding protein